MQGQSLEDRVNRLHRASQAQIDQLKAHVAQLRVEVDQERDINRQQAHQIVLVVRWSVRFAVWLSLLSAATYLKQADFEKAAHQLETVVQVVTAAGAAGSLGGLTLNTLKAKKEDVEVP
jgi:hypothetical protein